MYIQYNQANHILTPLSQFFDYIHHQIRIVKWKHKRGRLYNAMGWNTFEMCILIFVHITFDTIQQGLEFQGFLFLKKPVYVSCNHTAWGQKPPKNSCIIRAKSAYLKNLGKISKNLHIAKNFGPRICKVRTTRDAFLEAFLYFIFLFLL